MEQPGQQGETSRCWSLSAPSALLIGGLLIISFWLLLMWLSWHWLPLPQLGYLQDLGILVEAGWRFVQGQIPHRDYISPLGPVYALYAGLPQYWFGATYASYTHVQTACGLLISLISYFVLFNRLHWLVALAYSVVVGVVAGGTYHIGGPPELTTFATVYNRHLWALMMAIAPVLFLNASSQFPGGKLLIGLQGAVVGSVLAVLLFYKINFFAAGVALLVAGSVLNTSPDLSKLWPGVLTGFIAIALVFASLISWRFDQMAQDLMYAAGARQSGWMQDTFYFDPWRIAKANMVPLLFGVLLSVYASAKWGWRHLAAVWFVLFLGFGLMATNANGSGFGIPLIVTSLLIAAHKPWTTIRAREMSESLLVWGSAAIVAFSLIVWPQLISWRSWADVSRLIKNSGHPMSAPGTPLQGLYDSSDNMWGSQFWPRLLEGRGLIRKSLGPSDTLLYVDFTNLFNFWAGARSPQGTLLWVDYLSTFGMAKGDHPSPDELFADVDYVMFPKQPLVPETVNAWLKLYGDKMKDLFFQVDETESFHLMARVKPRGQHSEPSSGDKEN